MTKLLQTTLLEFVRLPSKTSKEVIGKHFILVDVRNDLVSSGNL